MGFVDDFVCFVFGCSPTSVPSRLQRTFDDGSYKFDGLSLGFPSFFECSDRAVCLLCFIFYLCCPLECRVR